MSETAIHILNQFANEQYGIENDMQFISYTKNIIRPLVADLLNERDELLEKNERIIKEGIQLEKKLNAIALIKDHFIEIYNDDEDEDNDI